MTGLRTSYDFTLPRGYVDGQGSLHKTGSMRLATARDELEPLRDPTINGPDDPRLTILVLARVVESLGDLDLVTPHEISGLFAVDLAFLQDFYGVINFGNQEEFDALVNAQESSALLGVPRAEPAKPGPVAEQASGQSDDGGPAGDEPERRNLRAAVEELPRRAQ